METVKMEKETIKLEKLSSEPISVLVADDHPIFRQGIVAALSYQDDMFVAAEAADGREALNLIRRHRPNVALLDMQMPFLGGIEIIKQIQIEKLNVKTVMLTMYLTDSDIRQALAAGASGYLLKDVSGDELTESILSVHNGQKRISAEVGAKLAASLDGETLTERETEVLRLMTAGKANREIADELFVAESTVKFHVKHILSKLHASDRTQAVITALKRGITRL